MIKTTLTRNWPWNFPAAGNIPGVQHWANRKDKTRALMLRWWSKKAMMFQAPMLLWMTRVLLDKTPLQFCHPRLLIHGATHCNNLVGWIRPPHRWHSSLWILGCSHDGGMSRSMPDSSIQMSFFWLWRHRRTCLPAFSSYIHHFDANSGIPHIQSCFLL